MDTKSSEQEQGGSLSQPANESTQGSEQYETEDKVSKVEDASGTTNRSLRIHNHPIETDDNDEYNCVKPSPTASSKARNNTDSSLTIRSRKKTCALSRSPLSIEAPVPVEQRRSEIQMFRGRAYDLEVPRHSLSPPPAISPPSGP